MGQSCKCQRGFARAGDNDVPFGLRRAIMWKLSVSHAFGRLVFDNSCVFPSGASIEAERSAGFGNGIRVVCCMMYRQLVCCRL